MEEPDLFEQLRAITNRFYQKEAATVLGAAGPPFDVSKPNLHDNKKEFSAEFKDVKDAIKATRGLLGLLAKGFSSDATDDTHAKALVTYVDEQVRVRYRTNRPANITDLIQKNAAEDGHSFVLAMLLFDYNQAMLERQKELRDQELEFWSNNSRPPNHYARTIALRFAREIARETGEKPTVGTSRDGGHPSTDYARALEEIFQLLKIRANVRRAAKWAVGQLTPEDLEPQARNALGSVFGGLRPPSQHKDVVNALLRYSKGLGD